MASSSGSGTGTSSGSTLLQNSGSEEDLQALMDQRKRKRMISNRESARRSRMRKQKHLDDLMAQAAQLRKENSQIITSMNVITQHYLNIEAENSVLKAQSSELSHRLQYLVEIVSLSNTSNGGGGGGGGLLDCGGEPWTTVPETLTPDTLMNPLGLMYLSQPIMAASADIFHYW